MYDAPAEPGHNPSHAQDDLADDLPPFGSANWPGYCRDVDPDPVRMGTELLVTDAVVTLFCQGRLEMATAACGEVACCAPATPAPTPTNALDPIADRSEYTFRRARRCDLPLLRRTRSWMRPLIVEGIEGLVRKGESQWAYLAESNGRGVGYIAGTFDAPDPADPARNWRRAVVTGLAVNPAWRRRGVGRFLVESFQRAAISRKAVGPTACGGGVIALFTMVPKSVPEAQRFFEALGFRSAIGAEGSSRAALERYRPWWD